MPELLQHYYTSCRMGSTQKAGFQTYSASKGLSEEESRELEQLGAYHPPVQTVSAERQSAPVQYPVSFRFFMLSSGRYGVAQSVHLGEDYSGRMGNYFSHSLVLARGRFPFHPIMLYQSPAFKDDLSSEQKNIGAKPPPLPGIALEDLACGETINQGIIQEFMSDPNRVAMFEQMLAALMYRGGEGRRRLVLTDQDQLPALWIGALQMSLPLANAHSMTFNTYTRDPERDVALVCATSCQGSNFQFSRMQLEYQFHAYDFSRGLYSPQLEIGKFPAAASVDYSISPGVLEPVHAFLGQFSYEEIDPDLDTAYNLYDLQQRGIGELNQRELVDALGFAGQYAPAHLLSEISERINSLLSVLPEGLESRQVLLICKFLAGVAQSSGSAKDFDQFAHFYQAMLDKQVFGTADPPRGRVLGLHAEVSNLSQNDLQAFRESNTFPKRLADLQNRLAERAGPAQGALQLVLILNDLMGLKTGWESKWREPEFPIWLETCLKALDNNPRELAWVLDHMAPEPELMAGLFDLAHGSAGINLEDLGKILSDALADLDARRCQAAFRAFLARGRGDILFANFSHGLEQAKDKLGFFRNYQDECFVKNPTYEKEYFTPAAQKLLFVTKNRSRLKAAGWIWTQRSLLNDIKVLQSVISICEQSLPFKNPKQGDYDLAIALSNEKRGQGINTDPDLAGVLAYSYWACISMRDKPDTLPILRRRMPSLERLDEQRYRKLIKWLLPALIPYTDGREDFADLTASLRHLYFTGPLADAILKEMESGKPKKQAYIDRVEDLLLFSLESSGEGGTQWGRDLKDRLQSGLPRILERLGDSALWQMENAVCEAFKPNTNVRRKIWPAIKGEVIRIRESKLLGKTMSFLKSLKKWGKRYEQ